MQKLYNEYNHGCLRTIFIDNMIKSEKRECRIYNIFNVCCGGLIWKVQRIVCLLDG